MLTPRPIPANTALISPSAPALIDAVFGSNYDGHVVAYRRRRHLAALHAEYDLRSAAVNEAAKEINARGRAVQAAE